MIRRMSKRFAALAAVAASTSGSSAMGSLTPSDEDDVEDHDEREGAHAEQPRRAVPDPVALHHALGLGVSAGQAPHQPPQLLLPLGLWHERHPPPDHGVGGEGDPRAPENRGPPGAENHGPPPGQAVGGGS